MTIKKILLCLIVIFIGVIPNNIHAKIVKNSYFKNVASVHSKSKLFPASYLRPIFVRASTDKHVKAFSAEPVGASNHEQFERYQRIAVIGTGYVGLITGACLAQLGHRVMCADIDRSKIELLQHNIIPIYEPGLEQLVEQNILAHRLLFTADIHDAIEQSDCIFIAVGTPMGSGGCADLSALHEVFSMIVPHLHSHKIICIKSTVPIGTGNQFIEFLEKRGISSHSYALVSNPEFLREGSAIHDFMNPDRIVIGAYCSNAYEYMKNLYQDLIEQNVPLVCTSITSSETIKYASNAFLATKLSFINEIANLCDTTGADIRDVAVGMGLDKRIGKAFLSPGPGFGGSCFPKDCHALYNIGADKGVNLKLVWCALQVNEEQKKKPVEKLMGLIDSVEGKTIAILGLAFKSNTDDIRYSPAITTIELLLKKGAFIKAYDPVANTSMKKLFPDLAYEDSLYQAVKDVDAIIIMTEWDEFKKMDLELIGELVKQRVIVDARNILDPALLSAYSFKYATMGRH